MLMTILLQSWVIHQGKQKHTTLFLPLYFTIQLRWTWAVTITGLHCLLSGALFSHSLCPETVLQIILSSPLSSIPISTLSLWYLLDSCLSHIQWTSKPPPCLHETIFSTTYKHWTSSTLTIKTISHLLQKKLLALTFIF